MSGRVLVVEEHGLVAMGMQRALAERSWNVEATSGPTALDAVAHAWQFEPECVLLDIHLGAGLGSGIDLIAPMTSTGSRVVMLTTEERRLVLAQCVEAGAVGWISKNVSLDELDATVADAISGRTMIGRADRAAMLDDLHADRAATARARAIFENLTRREALVLSELIDGLSAEEIAEANFVALTTVRSQIRCVLQKLGVRSQLAAVAVATAHRHLLPRSSRSEHDRRHTDQSAGARTGPAFRR